MATRSWTVTARTVWDVLSSTDEAGLWAAKPHYGPAEWMPPSTVIDGITLLPPHVPVRTVAYFGDAIVVDEAGHWSVERAAADQQPGTPVAATR